MFETEVPQSYLEAIEEFMVVDPELGTRSTAPCGETYQEIYWKCYHECSKETAWLGWRGCFAGYAWSKGGNRLYWRKKPVWVRDPDFAGFSVYARLVVCNES